MFADAAPLTAATALTPALAGIALALAGALVWRRRVGATPLYRPDLAWLRAGLYFCACLLVGLHSGVLAVVLRAPLASAAQLVDAAWWGLTLLYAGVVVVGYAMIWPRGTFTDGRRRHALLSVAYGALWGVCQGVLFLSIWSLVERSGLAVPWVALLSYLLIGAYNACLHQFFWDIHVSPPHNYSEWNPRKVLLCHTPNLILGMTYLALYGNAAIFVLLQGVALAASAFAMRFPAWWDDYRATPGEERTRLEPAKA